MKRKDLCFKVSFIGRILLGFPWTERFLTRLVEHK